MTTLYAYWDAAGNCLASFSTIGRSRKESGEKLMALLGEDRARELVLDGSLFLTEIKVERVV